jgi:hypothetical protein
MADDVIKLKFIDSVHEQREMNKRFIPIKGSWLELGDFIPVVERFDIKERYECVGTGSAGEGDDSTLWVDLKLVDHEKQRARASELADKIIAKHGDLLITSLRLMLIRGLYDRRGEFKPHAKERLRQRTKFAGDKEKTDDYIRLMHKKEELALHEADKASIQREIEELQAKVGLGDKKNEN